MDPTKKKKKKTEKVSGQCPLLRGSPHSLTDENFHCGGLLTNDSGSLSSPWYPKKYPTNVVCVWVIQVDTRAHVKLTFEVIK
jgi:hypothetical protein